MGSEKLRENGATKKNSVNLKTVSPTDLSEILRKFFTEVNTEKGKALTPCESTGINSAPSNLCSTQPKHYHFVIQRIHVCQQNVWSEGQAVCKRKQCKTKAQIIYWVMRHAKIESILHGRAEHGQHLERCGEVSWVYLVFFVLSFCSPRQRL